MPRRARLVHDERGFTLVETLVGMMIMGVALGIAVGATSSWSRAREHSGSAQEIVSLLRQAQQKALTEATSYCVTLDSETTYSMRRGTCAAATTKGPIETYAPAVTLSGTFTQSDGTAASQIVFTPRGTASPGTLTVSRDGEDPIDIEVEGLTGRVAID